MYASDWENLTVSLKSVNLLPIYMRKMETRTRDWFGLMLSIFVSLQQFLMSNKLETAMWLSRLFTVYCSVMFILPVLGWVHCAKSSNYKCQLALKVIVIQPKSAFEYLSLLVYFRPYAAANFYQRALLANALTSALRLHQRLPRFQLSRAFLAQALQEDSCHYLLYSLILVNSYPITSILSLWASLQD